MRHTPCVVQLLKRQHQLQKLYAASGAAPAQLLAPTGLAPPVATCFPSQRLRTQLASNNNNNSNHHTQVVDDDVVVYNHVVTSQGLGCCLQLAMELGELLFDLPKATHISNQLLVDRTGTLGCQRYTHKDIKLEIPYKYKLYQQQQHNHPSSSSSQEQQQDEQQSPQSQPPQPQLVEGLVEITAADAMSRHVKQNEIESSKPPAAAAAAVGDSFFETTTITTTAAAMMCNVKRKERESSSQKGVRAVGLLVLETTANNNDAMPLVGVPVMNHGKEEEELTSINGQVAPPAAGTGDDLETTTTSTATSSSSKADNNQRPESSKEHNDNDDVEQKRKAIMEIDKASSSSKTAEKVGNLSLSDTAAASARVWGVDDDDDDELKHTRASKQAREQQPASSMMMVDRSVDTNIQACLLPTAASIIRKRFTFNVATLRKASECRVAFQYVAPRQTRSRGAPKDSQQKTVPHQRTQSQEAAATTATATTSKPQKLSTPKKSIHLGRIKSSLFRECVLAVLESLGWTVSMKGSTYCYILPGKAKAFEKGRSSVAFQKSGKPSRDYYTDVPDLAKLLQSDARWKDNKEIRNALQFFEREVQKFMDNNHSQGTMNSPKSKNGPKSKKRKANASPASSPVKSSRLKCRPNNAMFREFVLPVLQDLGWSIESRSNRYYYIHPGMIDAFKSRLHAGSAYFDSTEKTIKFLESDERWKNNKEIHTAINVYEEAIRDYTYTGSSPAKTNTSKIITSPSQDASDEKNARGSLLSQSAQDGQANSLARLPETGEEIEGPDSVYETQSNGSSDNKVAANEIIKKRAFGQLWIVLETLGWTMTRASRPCDVYFYPPGITGGRSRKDYFDSKNQVLRFLRKGRNIEDHSIAWDIVLEALAAYDASPQTTTAKTSKNTTKSRDFTSVATSRNDVPTRNRRTCHSFLEKKKEKRKRSISSTRPKRRSSSEISSTAVSIRSSNASSLEKEARKNVSSTRGKKTRSQKPSSNTSQLEAVATVEPAQLYGACDVNEEGKRESKLLQVDEPGTRHNKPDELKPSQADPKMPNAAQGGLYEPETSQVSHRGPKGSNVHEKLEHESHSDPQELKKEPSMLPGEASAFASDLEIIQPANSFRAEDAASKKNDRLLPAASVDIPMQIEFARHPPSDVKVHMHAFVADADALLDVDVDVNVDVANHWEKVAAESVNTESSHTSNGSVYTESSHTSDVAAPAEEAPAGKPKQSLVMDVEEENY